MSSTKQIKHAKEIFQATLDSFRRAAKQQLSDKEPYIEAVAAEWQAIIDDGKMIKELSDIDNFESLLGYQRQFKNTTLTADKVISIDKQRAAEIDLAVHIQRNFPGEKIKKLTEVREHKSPDFAVGDEGSSLFEAKFLEKYSKSAVELKLVEALGQIKDYIEYEPIQNPWGKVHIFTFDRLESLDKMEVQRHIEQLVQQYSQGCIFPFEFSLQVYGHDYFNYHT